MADPFLGVTGVLLRVHDVLSAEAEACNRRPELSWKYTWEAFTGCDEDSSVSKEKAAMFLSNSGLGTGVVGRVGEDVADVVVELVCEPFSDSLCLSPKTGPNMADKTTINARQPQRIIHFLLECRIAGP